MSAGPAVAAQSPARQSLRCSSSFVTSSGSAFRAGSADLRTPAHVARQQQPLRQVSGVPCNMCNLHVVSCATASNPMSPCPQVTRMGLFGLGVPELALVAGAAALLFGGQPADLDMLVDICLMRRQFDASFAQEAE